MKTQIVLLALIANLIVSCITKKDQSSNEPSGSYTRENTFEVVHPETGIKIGTRTIRDTILIRSLDEGYEVSNSKWMKNDYDENGWRDMEHAEDRPLEKQKAMRVGTENRMELENGIGIEINLYADTLSIGQNVYTKLNK